MGEEDLEQEAISIAGDCRGAKNWEKSTVQIPGVRTGKSGGLPPCPQGVDWSVPGLLVQTKNGTPLSNIREKYDAGDPEEVYPAHEDQHGLHSGGNRRFLRFFSHCGRECSILQRFFVFKMTHRDSSLTVLIACSSDVRFPIPSPRPSGMLDVHYRKRTRTRYDGCQRMT